MERLALSFVCLPSPRLWGLGVGEWALADVSTAGGRADARRKDGRTGGRKDGKLATEQSKKRYTMRMYHGKWKVVMQEQSKGQWGVDEEMARRANVIRTSKEETERKGDSDLFCRASRQDGGRHVSANAWRHMHTGMLFTHSLTHSRECM